MDRFILALDDPGDPHWGADGEFRVRLRAEPAAVQDRNSLRRTLLQQPWTLHSSSAQWIVAAGIGSLRNGSSQLTNVLIEPESGAGNASLRTTIRHIRLAAAD